MRHGFDISDDALVLQPLLIQRHFFDHGRCFREALIIESHEFELQPLFGVRIPADDSGVLAFAADCQHGGLVADFLNLTIRIFRPARPARRRRRLDPSRRRTIHISPRGARRVDHRLRRDPNQLGGARQVQGRIDQPTWQAQQQ